MEPIEKQKVERKLLEHRFNLAELDYSKPILLREEYKNLPYEGNIDIESAEAILQRQFGVLKRCNPEDFKKVERVLSFKRPVEVPKSRDYKTPAQNQRYMEEPFLHSDIRITYKPKYELQLKMGLSQSWLKLFASKSFLENPKESKITYKVDHSRDKELLERARLIGDGRYKLRGNPVYVNILGIQAGLTELKTCGFGCPRVFVEVEIYQKDYCISLKSDTFLSVPFLNEYIEKGTHYSK